MIAKVPPDAWNGVASMASLMVRPDNQPRVIQRTGQPAVALRMFREAVDDVDRTLWLRNIFPFDDGGQGGCRHS